MQLNGPLTFPDFQGHFLYLEPVLDKTTATREVLPSLGNP